MLHRRWVVVGGQGPRRGLGPSLLVFFACALSASCGGDSPERRDTGGQRDGPVALPENTLERCTDGLDNDGDGKTDCADDDCGQLIVCQQQPDAALRMPENTSSACQDRADNDADGKTDCADEDCGDFFFCRETDGAAPDGPMVDGRPADGAADAPRDAPLSPKDAAPDGPVQDAPADAPVDAPSPDLPQGGCGTHCDCPQGWFCYKGTCVQDPKMPVYCCAKPGCPPGKLCMDLAGQKSTCAEDATYSCQTACDCGPAHCCVSGKCVKDTTDPWLPNGTAINGLSCTVGTDPTYCCEDFACYEGRSAYQTLGLQAFFQCFSKAGKQPSNTCGGAPCYGSACNCGDGEVCMDTATQPHPSPGETCHLASGGTCVAGATAEAIFAWAPSEILPCCSATCAPGTVCDAGWKRQGGKIAYQRVKASCGACGDGMHFTCGACGDGKCDAGEYPSTCPADCSCGDGACAPEEVDTCAADCGTCGDKKCNVGESPLSCPADCTTCGDGWCEAAELSSCADDCWSVCRDAPGYPGAYRACGDATAPHCAGDFKTCSMCAVDCPTSAWTVVHQQTAAPWNDLTRVWGSASDDVYALSSEYLLHYDGKSWGQMMVPNVWQYRDIWGSSSSDIYVLGSAGPRSMDSGAWCSSSANCCGSCLSQDASQCHGGCASLVAHRSGNQWSLVTLPAATVSYPYDDVLYYAVGGTSSTDVFVAGALVKWVTSIYDCGCTSSCCSTTWRYFLGCVVWHYDGVGWQQAAEHCVDDFWGPSASHVFGVSRGRLSYPASRALAHVVNGAWQVTYTSANLSSVWGSSATDVHAVGDVFVHSDGASWSAALAAEAHGVWGTSATSLFAVGGSASQGGPTMLHYDGSGWQRVPLDRGPGAPGLACAGLHAVWGTPAGEYFAVGEGDLILHCTGSGCVPPHWSPKPVGPLPNINASAPPAPPSNAGTCGDGLCGRGEWCGSTYYPGTSDYCMTACTKDCPGNSTPPWQPGAYCCFDGSCLGDACPVDGCPM